VATLFHSAVLRKQETDMASLFEILVVDDEDSTRRLLSETLAKRGYAVRTAEEGFQALRVIRSSHPSILLSDLNMPGMSGFELLSVVRRLYPLIKVVAMSGAYSGTRVPAGIAADSFYEKASGLTRLLDILGTLCFAEDESVRSARTAVPLWVDLQPPIAIESQYVLVNCTECMRPFRHSIQEVSQNICAADCSYCGGHVRYAIARAVAPSPADRIGKMIETQSQHSTNLVFS
jgi:CheY-like chemotaxis protein